MIADIGGDRLQIDRRPYHKLLSLLKAPQERCEGTNIHSVRQDGHQVIEDTGELCEEGSDPLGTLWDFDVQELLDCEREALLVRHHRNVVQSIEVRQCLEVCLVLDQLLRSSV